MFFGGLIQIMLRPNKSLQRTRPRALANARALRRAAEFKRSLADNTSLMTLKTLCCPYCKETISAARGLVRCRACRTFHHQHCWESNGQCSVYGCKGVALHYRGRFGRFAKWPINAIIVVSFTVAVLLSAAVFEIPWLAHLTFTLAGFSTSYLFFSAYRDPERSDVTRWLWDSCERQSIRGAKYLWILSIGSIIIAIANLASLFT